MTGSFAAFRALAARRGVPLTVHLELTARCNARCVHCYQGDHAASPRELSRQEWLRVVEEARAAGALVLTLSGGEALLSPHFWPVAERARDLGLALRIFTNGILLGRATAARLAALRPFAVELSVFSASAARHDAVTGVPGSLGRALRGALRLARAGVPLTLKCPLVGASAADHAAVRRLAARLGASVSFDPQIFPRFDGGSGPTRCRGEDAVVEGYFADPATLAHDAPRSEPRPSGSAPCTMGRGLLVVSWDGDVLPCPVLRRSAGNVRDAALAEIWRASPLLVALRSRRFGELPVCGTCPRSGYCDRCSAIALLEDGDLDGPSSRACRVAELRERAWGVPPPEGAPAVKRRPLPVLRDA